MRLPCVHTLLARRRVLASSGEEVCEGPVGVAQRLLLCDSRHGRDPLDFGPQRRQLFLLTGAGDALAGLPPVGAPEVAPLLESKVVDEAAHARELPEERLLFGRGIDAETEAAMR